MLFRTIQDWLLPRSGRPYRNRHPCQRRLSGFYGPSIEPLEDRRLLSATTSTPDPAAVFASPLDTLGATVVGRNIFYNNSRFDGNNPAAGTADDGAIAPDKSALLPGQTATFANYTSYSGGINGLMVDIAGLAGVPTASDFVFRVGNNNAPGSWALAPSPSSLTVRPGAGLNGSTRVTLIWPDDAIKNQWLQVDVRATPNTGLLHPDVFFFGNTIGESGNTPLNAIVDATDQVATQIATGNGPYTLVNPAPITSRADYNRDGLVNSADQMIAYSSGAVGLSNRLRLLAVSPDFGWADVAARRVFYNNSQFDGNDPSANSSDDNAIAPDKTALLPGGKATIANYTSYSRGINGIMIDIAGLTQTPTVNDFDFRVGNNNDPASWTLAPSPSSISVRYGAGLGGSTRVTLLWPDNVIQRQWLQVTVKVTPNTRLTRPDVFYFGNTIGETGNSTTNASVSLSDETLVHNALGSTGVPINSPLDMNRDRVIDANDVAIVHNNIPVILSLNLRLISLPAANSNPPFVPPSPDTTGERAYVDFVNATVGYVNPGVAAVVDRKIFYNNSSFDGNNSGPNPADDNAIALDKSALLPGATATFANYTSYSRGINGIMVDIAGLTRTPTADDFLFRVGNSPDPSAWSLAPRPSSVTVRQGAGTGGSARVTIVWPDNMIQNQWLQVTVRATANTGLETADVFYFGNAEGESGDTAANAVVNATDQVATRNSPYTFINRAPITSPVDYNRDGLVDSADEWIAVRNSAGFQHSLELITVPPDASPTFQREPPAFINSGDGGINIAFAPAVTRTNDGTLLFFAQARSGVNDSTSYGIVMRRSTDKGASWSPVSIAFAVPFSTVAIGPPAVIVDSMTGQVFLLFTQDNSSIFVMSSSDDGLTWSARRDITSGIKVTTNGNPNPSSYPDTPWDWYAVGPGHGIQIQHGPYAGRLILAGDHRLTGSVYNISWSQVIYSDDHGLSWHLGGGLDQTNASNNYSNEASIVEQSDGTLYMNIRVNNGSKIRGFSRSYDGGMTWTTMALDGRLTTFPVEASLLRIDDNTVLLSAPDSLDGTRHQMTIWVSHDDMHTWVKTKTVFFGYASYSDMVLAGPDTVLLAYNMGHSNGYSITSMGLARFNLQWLENSDPYQFTWNFNEQAPGTAANILGTSIRDSSPWDNRAQAQADSPAEAPRYVVGPSGNIALELTRGSDSVMLTPAATNALQFFALDSFTVEITMRTTDSTGVIIGTRPDVPNWTLQLVNGFPQFSATGLASQVVLTSSMPINDGNWHRIVVVRDAMSHQLSMYIDGVQDGPGVAEAVGSLQSNRPVTLGAYNDGSGQLAFDVDTLRVTRAVLTPSQFLPGNYVEPPRPPDPSYGSTAPNTIPNLKFWLPAYDYAHYFADTNFANPLPNAPTIGSAVRSAIDASSSQFKAVMSNSRLQLYANDPDVGPNWRLATDSPFSGQGWIVQNSNGTNPNNFDFVQDTGMFTLSTFAKLGPSLGTYMALFDTNESALAHAGFSLVVLSNGAVNLLITEPDGTVRFNQASPPGTVSPGTWYHIAVVGNGAGNPITFYITHVTNSSVVPYVSSAPIAGPDGNYPTDAAHDLAIGDLAVSRYAAFNGQMVDQAIYDRALSPAEIQQLYDFTKKI